MRESAGAGATGSVGHEAGAAESSAGPYSNSTHAHQHEPVGARETFTPPEPRETRNAPAPEAPARHEQPAAPLAHFEPSPPLESAAPRESKPYVVWSSAPPDKAASGGNRGPEE